MTIISIDRLEKAINDCRLIHPPVNGVLGQDLRQLATVWGEMIAKKEAMLDLSMQPAEQLKVLRRWLGAAAGEMLAPVCNLNDGEVGSCEACQ
jgi:hypothetical protein